MESRATLHVALCTLREVVESLDDSEMDTVTNCAPWTVRRLASHALNNQLVWAGLVAGEELVPVEDAMTGVPLDGDLGPRASDVAGRAWSGWNVDGVLERTHETPFGTLPGSVVILFPTVDAFAHAWDVSASLARAVEFAPSAIPAATAVFEATCTDAARAAGLIQAPTVPPTDATDTERLLALAGRTIVR